MLLVGDLEDEFVATVRRLKQEPEFWQQLSQAAREKIAAGYAHDVCVDEWEKLLRELNAQLRDRQPIQIPRRITLPPVHPGLRNGGPREPAFHQQAIWRSRMLTGRWKQQLLKQLSSRLIQ